MDDAYDNSMKIDGDDQEKLMNMNLTIPDSQLENFMLQGSRGAKENPSLRVTVNSLSIDKDKNMVLYKTSTLPDNHHQNPINHRDNGSIISGNSESNNLQMNIEKPSL